MIVLDIYFQSVEDFDPTMGTLQDISFLCYNSPKAVHLIWNVPFCLL